MSLKAISPGAAWLLLGIHVPCMGEAGSWCWSREQPLSLAPSQGMHSQTTGIEVCLELATGHSSCKQGPETPRQMMDWAMTDVQHHFPLDSSRKLISQGGQMKEPVPGQVMAQFMNIKIAFLSLHWNSADARLSFSWPFLYYAFIRFQF